MVVSDLLVLGTSASGFSSTAASIAVSTEGAVHLAYCRTTYGFSGRGRYKLYYEDCYGLPEKNDSHVAAPVGSLTASPATGSCRRLRTRRAVAGTSAHGATHPAAYDGSAY